MSTLETSPSLGVARPRAARRADHARRTPATTRRGGSGTACSTCSPSGDRPCARRGRRRQGRELRPRDRNHARRAGRRALVGGLLDLRRRHRPRPLPDEGRLGRPGRADGEGAGGRTLGRRRPRDAGVRVGRPRRADLAHRDRRAHARRRGRLAVAAVRPDDRQPALGRPGHGRRPARDGIGARASGSVLGAARRLGQLRRRGLVRVPAAPGRAARPRRPDLLRARRCAGRAPECTRCDGRSARRGVALARAHPRSTGTSDTGRAPG